MSAGRLRILLGPLALLAIGSIAVWCGFNRPSMAAEPLRGKIEFDRADVPADLPAAWPIEIDRCEPYPRQEFIQLIDSLNARTKGPRPSWLKSAHYEATLVNDTLTSGLMTASIQRVPGRSSLLDLGPFSFSLEELKWQDRPAIWGSSADGRTWVVTSDGNNELLGEWNCRGRSFSGGLDFDLQLPPATASFLDLRIPRTYSVHVPRAEVTLLSDIPTEATRLWRIHCGSENRCRITLIDREGIDPGRRVLLVEHDMQVIVREEDLRFQLNLHLDALDQPVQELTLRMPAHLVDYSAVYGAETPIPIQRTAESDADGRVKIRLPGPLSDRRRTLRIDGIALQKPGQPTVVPRIVVEDSTFDGGQLAVNVQAPLQVRSFRASGYRQRTTDADSMTFQQLTEDSQLILDLQRKQTSMTGQVLNLLDIGDDSWNLNCEIAWNSLTAGIYQTSVQFPPEWEVTDVKLVGPADSLKPANPVDETSLPMPTPKLNWDVKPQGAGSILTIEFLQAIQTGKPRAVRVIARRAPAQPGQLIPVPVPQLLNCEVSDVLLGIHLPNTATPDISTDSRLERTARPTSTVLSIPPEKQGLERRWYRADAFDGTGTFKLTPRLQPVQVKTETAIEALPAEYRVKYSIQYDHREVQADRLLVYLTETSPDIRWVWKGTQTVELAAARLTKSQHVEWNLPSSGELWEIRVPRTVAGNVVIEGSTTNRWSVTNRPALLFIPQAVDKLAELRMTHPDAVEVKFDTDGLRPMGQPSSWWYATPQARIELTIGNSTPSNEFPLMVSMQLHTLMSADAGGYDLYRVRIQLENGSDQESLGIKLDPNAIVQEANVRDESIAASVQGGEFVIPGLSAARRDTVELIYRVPVVAKALRDRRQIVVPQLSAQVLGFFWEFRIPPSARLFNEPSGIRLSRSMPGPTWNERLFGPLGRTGTEGIFYPFSVDAWRQLSQPQPTATPSMGDFDDELVAPVDWQVHQAMSPDVPLEITVELWHAVRVKLLTWICLVVCLTAGVLLRLLSWTRRDRVAAYGLGLSLAAAFSAPAPYAGFLGGAIAGTVISLLIPRQLIHRTTTNADRSGDWSGLLQPSIACLIGAVTFLALSYFTFKPLNAQETPVDEPAAAKRPIVYVPVDNNGQPSESRKVVYVPPDALARWKALASELPIKPTYLISSARYEVAGSTEGSLNLTARYRVHMLGSAVSPATVVLGLTDVSLPDTESCRVNGVPHPITALPNGKGYSLELSRPSDVKTEIDAKPNESERDENEITTFEIELRTRKPRPPTTGFDLKIPPVANSEFALSFRDPMPFVEIAGGRGSTVRLDNRSIVASLGGTPNVQVRWGQLIPPRKSAQMTVSLLQHLELRPAYCELFFHMVGTLEDGSVESLEFELPPNAIVRRVQSRGRDLLRDDLIATKEGQRRLRLVFDKRQQSTVTIDGSLVIPSDSLVRTQLPQFGLANTDQLQCQFEHNWWGVSTSNEFRLESQNLDPENVSAISPDAYLNAWFEAADPKHPESLIPHQPQSTFGLRSGTLTLPAFTLVPTTPRRKATQWRQTAFIGPRRLEWALVGEIETTQAPTFQTVLLVDRRLRIEKISVMENDAERRSYWTESRTDPSRVVLFLNDKTTGKQTVTLRGSLPLIPGVPVALPSVRPEDCEITESRLVLLRDPDVEVALAPPAEWRPISTDDASPVPSSVVMGSYFLPDPNVRATIQTSARHARSSCRAAVLMTRIDDLNWKLKYRLEMVPEGASPLRMGLTFPAAFADLNSVTVERAEPAWHEVHDGVRQLDLLLDRRNNPENVVVQFETTLTEPKQQDWELPLPIPLPQNAHETILVVESESNWFPKGGVELRVADLPEWSADFYDDLPGSAIAFKVAEPVVQIQRQAVSTDAREPSVRILDQRVWLHQSGRQTGISQAFLSSVRNDLEIELPPQVQVTAIFLNDRPLALTMPVNGRLKIPLTDAGTESILTFSWTSDEGASSASEQLPWPYNIKVERNLVTILPDDPKGMIVLSGLSQVGSLDQGLDRLEAVLERHAALGAETRGAAANRWFLDQLQARLAKRLPIEVRHPTAEIAQQLQRWNRIVNSINQLEAVPNAPALSWYARLLEGPLTDQTAGIRGVGEKNVPIRFWMFDRRLILAASSLLLALILIPMFRRLIRIEWSEWLHRHVAVSWLLLAGFWWLFLTPSAFGPMLVVVAIGRGMSQYKPLKPAPEA